MTARIYLLNGQAELTAMDETPYDSEQILQEILAQHPDLLAGEQINREEPRRWLLVTREMAVPGELNGARRWSLDHLFLDQDGVPTLIEVKRSTDTRIRREVIGQMLDYAANAVVYWPVEQIRAMFERRCDRAARSPEAELAAFLGDEHNIEDFWMRVKTNLQAGRIRIVFLADSIPIELRRIVEFLNEQMDPAEVLAVEIKQFVGKGMRTLVPRVLGQTEAAIRRKIVETRSRETTSESNFIALIEANQSDREAKEVRHLIDWARNRGLEDNFLIGSRGAVFEPILHHCGESYRPLFVQQDGFVTVPMKRLKNRPPFSDPQQRSEVEKWLTQIDGVIINESGMEGFPKIPIASLSDDQQRQVFIEGLNWMVAQIRAVP